MLAMFKFIHILLRLRGYVWVCSMAEYFFKRHYFVFYSLCLANKSNLSMNATDSLRRIQQRSDLIY